VADSKIGSTILITKTDKGSVREFNGIVAKFGERPTKIKIIVSPVLIIITNIAHPKAARKPINRFKFR
jgi:hypothetical protein